MPLPAMSKAVPWSTEVRMIGRPSVMLTPLSASQRPVAGSTLNPSSLTGICPWSWYMATTASYWPARSLTNTVSPGTGPTTSIPSATHRAMVGSLTSMSCRPNRPPSPACGFSAATAIRALATPRSRSALWVRSMTKRSRCGVSLFGTSSSATWVETWLTRMLPCASSMTEPETPVSAASISVWPAYW
jgi:hypothetical protein